MLSSSIASKPESARAGRSIERLSSPESSTHAVLLYGSVGSGKRHLANALAKAWMCLSPGPEGACGSCKSCTTFENGLSSDLLVHEPGGQSNWIPAAWIDSSASCPEWAKGRVAVIDFLRTAPLRSSRKVVVLRDAERMVSEAANALLKTLEEPPPHGKLILTTSEVGRVLPTVVSRCVVIACELPFALECPEWPEAVLMAEGSPSRLAQILQHSSGYRQILECVSAIAESRLVSALVLAERFRQGCDTLKESLDCSVRQANVEGLRALGAYLAATQSKAEWLQAVAEAHRRVQGNGSFGSASDALFVSFFA